MPGTSRGQVECDGSGVDPHTNTPATLSSPTSAKCDTLPGAAHRVRHRWRWARATCAFAGKRPRPAAPMARRKTSRRVGSYQPRQVVVGAASGWSELAKLLRHAVESCRSLSCGRSLRASPSGWGAGRRAAMPARAARKRRPHPRCQACRKATWIRRSSDGRPAVRSNTARRESREPWLLGHSEAES